MQDTRSFNIPSSYGDNKAVLMVRDPRTVFAYWEIRQDIEDNLRKKIQEKGLKVSKSVLRVYDVTENDPDSNPKIVFDFELRGWASSWYIHTDGPGREWLVDIGLLCETGEFFTLVRSNRVRTPSDRTSNTMRGEDNSHIKKLLASIGFSSGLFGDRSKDAGKK